MNIVVWGGSRGIGKAIVEELWKQKHQVLAISRHEENLLALTKRCPGVHIWRGDIRMYHHRIESFHRAKELFPTVDGLVINSGGPPKGRIDQLSLQDFDEAYHLLLQSAIHLTLLALPLFQQQGGGRILYITSVAAKEPIPDLLLSSTMRAGILSFMKGTAKTLAKENIALFALLPGYTRTERLIELYGALDNPQLEKIVQTIPLKRLLEPGELASFAAYLLTEAPMALTGQAITIDGGASGGF